jgi:hypothetical protein
MEADELANWLLRQDSAVTLQRLYEMLEGEYPVPEDFSWIGLAECAAYDAFHTTFRKLESPSLPNLGWARVAALAYSYAIHADKSSGRPKRKKFTYLSLEVALMRIQVRCILASGQVAGDPVLDINNPIQCFLENLPFSPEEASQKYAVGGKNLPSKERREFVRIRMKLAALRPLKENHMLSSNADLLAWFAVWDQPYR